MKDTRERERERTPRARRVRRGLIILFILLLLGGLFWLYARHQARSADLVQQLTALEQAQTTLQQKIDQLAERDSQSTPDQEPEQPTPDHSAELTQLAADIADLRAKLDAHFSRHIEVQYQNIVNEITILAGSDDEALAALASSLIAQLTNHAGPGISLSGPNGTIIENTGVLSVNGANGQLTLQGTPDQTTVSQSGDTITIGTAQDIAPTSSPTFHNQTLTGNLTAHDINTTSLSATTLSVQSAAQNGHALCDASNNCGYQTTAPDLSDIDATRLGGQLPSYYTNASNINTGLLADARLSPNVALKDASNIFTGTNVFAGLTATGILQGGYQVCDASNNCNHAAATGGNGYIQNQTASAQAAGFHISGNGTIGGALLVQGGISSPGVGANSEVFGLGAQATGNSSIAIGRNAGAAGSTSVAIGRSTTVANGSVAIGDSASCVSSGYCVAVGRNASASTFSTALGHGSNVNSQYGTALGYQSTAGSYTLALGSHTYATHQGSIAIGTGTTTTDVRQLVIGSSYGVNTRIEHAYIGNGVTAASPQGFTLNATGGEGVDVQGANLQLAGGRSTGTGAGGDIVFALASRGSASGVSQNSLTERLRITLDNNHIPHLRHTHSSIRISSSNANTHGLVINSGADDVRLSRINSNTSVAELRLEQSNVTVAGRLSSQFAVADRQQNEQFFRAISGSNASNYRVIIQGGSQQTHDIFAIQSNGSNASDILGVKADGNISIGTTANLGQLGIVNNTASEIGLVVRGHASQTADLLQVQSSDSAPLLRMTSAGTLALVGNGTLAVGNHSSGGAGGSDNAKVFVQQTWNLGSGVTIKSADNAMGGGRPGQLQVRTSNNQVYFRVGGSQGTLGLRAITGQTADILNIQDANGDLLANIDINGKLTVKHAEVQGNLTVAGKIIGNSDTRGTITIPAGATSHAYTFSSAYASAPFVVATPVGDPGVRYWLSDITTSGFTVNLESARPSDTVFNFIVQQ